MSERSVFEYDCWPWTGPLDRHGYGKWKPTIDGKQRTLISHRVVYEQAVGPIPPGLTIDHLCRNRACQNTWSPSPPPRTPPAPTGHEATTARPAARAT